MSCDVYYRPYYRQCLLLSELLFSLIYGEMIRYIENILFEPRLYIFAIEMPASPFDEKHRVLRILYPLQFIVYTALLLLVILSNIFKRKKTQLLVE
jgi:hypothetical protein